MKNLKKIICMLASLIMAASCFAFVGCNDPIDPVDPDAGKIDFATYKESAPAPTIENDDLDWIPTFSRAEVIGSFICDLDKAGNDTLNRVNVGGTDLGLSINVKSQGDPYTLLLFGDTFRDQYCKADWRCGVIAKTQDYNLANNLTLNSFWTKNGFKTETDVDNYEYADAIIYSAGDTVFFGETTKIFTGGCEVGDTIYAFYISRREQNETKFRPNYNNYGGCIKSEDGGVTWSRVYDLTWANHGYSEAWLNGDNQNPEWIASEEGQKAWSECYCHPVFGTPDPTGSTSTHASALQSLVNEEICGEYAGLPIDEATLNGVDLDINNRVAFHFTQIYPVVAGDGYVYMFGRGGYRSSGLALARVTEANIEVFAEYEYYTADGWKKGIEYADQAVMIVDRELSNMSIVYNDYVNKWVLSYLDCKPGTGAPIVISYSDDLINWSEPTTLFENSGETKNHYGGYLNEMWVENYGQTYYFVYSRWIKNTGVYRSYIAKATVDRVPA